MPLAFAFHILSWQYLYKTSEHVDPTWVSAFSINKRKSNCHPPQQRWSDNISNCFMALESNVGCWGCSNAMWSLVPFLIWETIWREQEGGLGGELLALTTMIMLETGKTKGKSLPTVLQKFSCLSSPKCWNFNQKFPIKNTRAVLIHTVCMFNKNSEK